MDAPEGFAEAAAAAEPLPAWMLAALPHQLHSDPIEVSGARAAFKAFFGSESMFPALRVTHDDFGLGDELIYSPEAKMCMTKEMEQLRFSRDAMIDVESKRKFLPQFLINQQARGPPRVHSI